MPRGLDSADRKLLIGAGALLIILVLAAATLTPPQISGESEAPSSYSSSWDGAEGAFLLLQRLGYNVSRWEKSPTELPQDPSGSVLILADPTESPSLDEVAAITEFMANGGRIVATGLSASSLLGPANLEEGDPLGPKMTFHAQIPSPLVVGAPQITMTGPEQWTPLSVRTLVVYGENDIAAVLTSRRGKGELIWWAAPTPLTNGAILDAGNLAFFLNCIGPPGHGQVLWDEYFHGMRGSLLDFFSRTPVFWGVAQFGLVFLAMLATYSRRLGPVRAPAVPSRLSPLEFIDTLGDLYASARVSAAAIGIAYRRLRFTLTRKLGLPIDVPSPELASLASQGLGWEETPLAETLKRCDAIARAGDAKVEKPLELFQQIHDYSARLEARRLVSTKGKTNEQGE